MQRLGVPNSGPGYGAAFALIVSLFVVWGLGQRLYDTLMPQFAQAFVLRDVQLALTQGVCGVVYFLAAIPSALFAYRFGYKVAIIFGLGSLCVGAFLLYPAAETRAFPYYLFAAVVMSWGWILLEVVANPLAASFGTGETSVRYLNVAQSWNPVGGLLGIYIGQWIVVADLVFPAERNAYSIAHPYIVIGVAVLVLVYLIENARFPAVTAECVRGLRDMAGEFRALASRRIFAFGIVAQFFCVMALAGTWSQAGRYFAAALPGAALTPAGNAFVWSFAVFAVGRFAGSLLMYRIRSDRLLGFFAGGGFLLAGLAAVSGGPFGAAAMIASNFFLSITWPTVLGIAIRGLGPRMVLGTALVCMGGAAGSIAYQMLNVVWKFPTAHFAMAVPAVCYAAILAFARAAGARKPIQNSKL
jgi:MFS transporter, FHS family, L-fucose permease